MMARRGILRDGLVFIVAMQRQRLALGGGKLL